MAIRRIVPNVASSRADLCWTFYGDFLGLRLAMDLGWIMTYASPDNPTAQVSIACSERSDAPSAATVAFSITIEADDVERLHGEAVSRGLQIVYPLTDEPWGVRRFAVADPNGLVINIMRHTPQPANDPTPHNKSNQ